MIFLFPNVFATELREPSIVVPLADVPTATKVVIRYNYDAYWLDMANVSVDCGTGSCTLPVDPKLGTIYFRILYLNSSNTVIDTSGVQTF